ncbi:MAG: carboxylesterase/lipase family protein [Oscillospiraceae bacterium]|nr:carboxylesterase/lipase family protein [Oscillospiraceae bacterium]
MNDFLCNLDAPIIQTPKGKLRGFYQDGVYHFRGIRYGTAERFMAPRPVEPWEGVKDALVWGYTAPVPANWMIGDDFTVPHRFWPQSEDCLYLNVWSRDLDAVAGKPVMVWIHGGGFFNGSSMEMIAYDGDGLAKFGDVVLVSVNHRLNHLGYLDLSSFGERYRNSGNRGQEDLVLALQWVQENIAAFGGDPDNVTIFGQSGGGGKVITLLQTPAADGLFHKAIIQSGVGAGLGEHDSTRHDAEIARKTAELLCGDADNIACLENAPLADLQKAYMEAANAISGGGFHGMMGNRPTPNDWFAGDPMVVGFTEHAKTIPLMVGTVCAEMGYPGKLPARDTITDDEALKLIGEEYGEEPAQAIFDAYKAAYPNDSPAYALYLSNRLGCLDFCKKFAEAAEATVFNYNFALVFPYNGGTPAWHCAEIPFVFHNAKKLALYQFPGAEAVEETTSRAWVNFARTGNPSGGAVGTWPALTSDTENTYVFDFHSEAKSGYDRTLMELVAKYQKPRFFSM